MSITVEDIPSFYLALRARWKDRDERMQIMDDVVKGNWSIVDPDDDEVTSRSPNMIQVALEDTAEAASYQPTIRVKPSGAGPTAKKKASAMEELGTSYLDVSRMKLLTIKSLQDLAGFGMFSWLVSYDEESQAPVIRWRDPRTCYPEFGYQAWDSVRTCVFAREVYVRQLPELYQEKVRAAFGGLWERDHYDVLFHDRKVTLTEICEQDAITVAALYSHSQGNIGSKGATWLPVLLDVAPTLGGICPVVVGERLVLDNEPRGQFDQVVGVLQAHIRLMSMVLDYSDQMVYSDIWVKDLVGQMSYGGGAYIQLGPQGQIGRVPPAVSSFSVQQELEQLVNNVHLGGRWPKTRPGEIDQAIASAKFVEATAGMMNTVIRTYHLIMQEHLESALRICFKQDALKGPKRTVAGILRNQQFMVERSKDDIDLAARVQVDYGIGLGRDPAQSLVLGIQGAQTGMWSNDFVQENFDGLTDIEQERRRIDVNKFKDMAFAQLLNGLQTGSIPQAALVKIAQARATGEDIFALFQEYVVAPAEELAQQSYTSGLTGEQVAPGGAPPGAGGPAPPVPPDGAALLGALAGAGPGAAGAETMSRLSVPLGEGSFANSQVKR